MAVKCHLCNFRAANDMEDMDSITDCPECNIRFTRDNWARDFTILNKRIPETVEEQNQRIEDEADGRYSFRTIHYLIDNRGRGIAPGQEQKETEIENLEEEGFRFLRILTPRNEDDDYCYVAALYHKENRR